MALQRNAGTGEAQYWQPPSPAAGEHPHSNPRSTSATLVAALNTDWLAPLIGEAAIVEGHGAFSGEGWRGIGPATSALRRADEDGSWRAWRSTRCPAPWGNTSTSAQPSIGSSTGYGTGHGTGHGTVRAPANNAEERMLLGALNMRWCKDAVERYETSDSISSGTHHPRRRRFELVVFTRPDILWHTPVRPWASWDAMRLPLVCFPRKASPDVHADSFWVTPVQMLQVIEPLVSYRCIRNMICVHLCARVTP